jgi:hypothetical protein
MDYIDPFESLSAYNIHIDLHGWILWIVLGVFLLIYGVIGAILLYHWGKYGMKNHNVILAELLFILVSALLIYLAVMGVLLS